MGFHLTSTPDNARHQIPPPLAGEGREGARGITACAGADACPLWLRFARLSPRKRGRNFWSVAPGHDYGSADGAFLGIRAVFAGKTGFSFGTGPPGARFTTYSWSPITVLGPV